ncbi:hypothetical protein AB1I63_00875 [Streptococcus pneumoniae]
MRDEEVIAHLYLSSPVKMVVGSMHLGRCMVLKDLLESEMIDDTTSSLLEQHVEAGSRYALPIKSLSLFTNPMSLAEIREIASRFNPPQSYYLLEKYPALYEQLVKRSRIDYAINPLEKKDYLGLFVADIVERYEINIPVVEHLQEYL